MKFVDDDDDDDDLIHRRKITWYTILTSLQRLVALKSTLYMSLK